MTTIEDCRKYLETPTCYRSDVVEKNKFKPDPQNTDAIYDYLLNTSNKDQVQDCKIEGQQSGTATGRCFQVCDFDTTMAHTLFGDQNLNNGSMRYKNLCKTIFSIYKAQSANPTATLNTLIILPTKIGVPQSIFLNNKSIEEIKDSLDKFTIKLKFKKDGKTKYHDSLINEESISGLYKNNDEIVECYLFYVLLQNNEIKSFKTDINKQIQSDDGLEISQETFGFMIALELIDVSDLHPKPHNGNIFLKTPPPQEGKKIKKILGLFKRKGSKGGSRKRTKRKSRNKKRKIKRTRRH